MRDVNTGNKFYADNFAAERQAREVEKYGVRAPLSEMAAHPFRDERHSIEPSYGHYDRPINESV